MSESNAANNDAAHNVPLTTDARDQASCYVIVVLVIISIVPPLVYAMFLPHLFFHVRDLGQSTNNQFFTTHAFLGYTIAAYYLVKMFFSPIVGWMSGTAGVRQVLLLLMVCEFVGSAVFALTRCRWLLLISYALQGSAAANSTVCRAYVPRLLSSSAQQTQLLAWITTGTTFGFIVGPAIGSMLALIDCPAESQWSAFAFNGCTAPGWVGAALSVVAICVVLLLPADGQSRQTRPSQQPNQDSSRWWHMDGFPAFATLAFQQLAIVLPFASIETLTAPICADAYGWTPKQVGILFSVGSICTLPVSFMLKPLMTACGATPRGMLLFSMLGQFLAVVCLDDFQQPVFGDATPLAQFVIAFCAFYIFYVIAQICVFSVFYSKFAGHPMCGSWVGFISSAGSLGRFVWPIISVNLLSIGGGIVWLSTAIVLAVLGPCLLAFNYRRLR